MLTVHLFLPMVQQAEGVVVTEIFELVTREPRETQQINSAV